MKTHKPTNKTGADLLGHKTYQNSMPLGWQGPGLAKNVDDKVALTWNFSPVADGVVNAVNGIPSANDRPRRFHRLAVEHHSAWSLQHA